MTQLDWFLTKKGQKLVTALVVGAAGCLGTFHQLSNSFFLYKYKDLMQMYRDAEGMPVPAEVLERANKVLDDCAIKEKERKAVSFFTVLGFDTWHAGSTALRHGAIVGIPRHFAYKQTTDVERGQLLVGGTNFQFSSDVGKLLLKSMVSSELAQRFAICREIHAGTTHYVHIQSVVSMVCVILPYSIANYANRRFNLFRLNRSIRMGMYFLTSCIGLATYLMMTDAVNLAFEGSADRAAAHMSAEYARGAVEYYENMLERNRCLRTAMGEKGKKQYTISGNVVVTLRTPSTPLTIRLDRAKEMVEEWKSKSETSDTSKQK